VRLDDQKEDVCVFQRNIPPFELWLVINPLGVCFVWGAKQVTISSARAASLMFAFRASRKPSTPCRLDRHRVRLRRRRLASGGSHGRRAVGQIPG
jgi:hypothetical protein